MNSVDKLFPWVCISAGVFLIGHGINGLISGSVLLLSTFFYFYKANRNTEFKAICISFFLAIILLILLLILNITVSFQPTH